MNEQWKTIYLYPSYMISNYGQVMNQFTGKILKPVKMKNGYLTVNLYDKRGQHKNCYIHRLVAKAFIENKNRYTEINHIDEDKENNRASNLEWCSRSYNINYGKANLNRQLCEGHKVVAIKLKSKEIFSFNSVKSMCRELNIDESSCRRVLDHKNHCKSLHGYTFVYDSEYHNDKLEDYVNSALSKNDSLKKRVCAYPVDSKNSKKIFNSVADTAKYVGFLKSYVSRVARGQCKQSHGWIFKYID